MKRFKDRNHWRNPTFSKWEPAHPDADIRGGPTPETFKVKFGGPVSLLLAFLKLKEEPIFVYNQQKMHLTEYNIIKEVHGYSG